MLNPHYHSIEGQSLFFVHWEAHFPGIKMKCPCNGCQGELKADRTNFSKNRKLFPLFRLSGPTSWCVVMSYACSMCKVRFDGNNGQLLASLPEYVRNAYPVEPKFADSSSSFHIDRDCSHWMEEIMLTYGNGDLLARIIYSAINKEYLRRLSEYLSYWQAYRHVSAGDEGRHEPPIYPKLDGEFITVYPPSGDSLRDLFDQACSSNKTSYGISDHDRCVREIQSVGTNSMFAQDHTHEAMKNYRSNVGGFAIWDCATETGEIASAVVVGSTKVRDIAHAAESLARRPHFNPVVMYSDTWPNKENFWNLIFGEAFGGRLGLFHYQQRIIKTLRQGHVDYHMAVRDLCDCVYEWEAGAYKALLQALKEGKMGRDSNPVTNREITEMKMNGTFKKRYQKYLPKKIRPSEVIEQKLEDWFCRYKCSASDPNERPGRGREDPITGKKLFTVDTKVALIEQKNNANQIQDALPLDEVYRKILPTSATRHGLPEYVSLRCESKLELFHDHLANFANCGMRMSLCDNINLLGTSRYNVKIRHKITMADDPVENRNDVPSYWANKPSFMNHSELTHVNKLAEDAGYPVIPFPEARPLPDDNGERFFAEYWMEEKQRQETVASSPLNDRCYCSMCGANEVPIPHRAISNSVSNNEDTNGIVGSRTATIKETTPPRNVVDPKRAATSSGTRQPLRHVKPRMDNIMARQHVSPPTNSFFAMYPTGYMPMQMMFPPQQFNFVPQQMPVWGGIQPTARPKAQQQLCCEPFLIWCQRDNRNGRPPHSKGCPNSTRKVLT